MGQCLIPMSYHARDHPKNQKSMLTKRQKRLKKLLPIIYYLYKGF